MVGSKRSLKMHVWNRISLPPTNARSKNHLFRGFHNLTATVTAYIFGMKHSIHKRTNALQTTRGLLHRLEMTWCLMFCHRSATQYRRLVQLQVSHLSGIYGAYVSHCTRHHDLLLASFTTTTTCAVCRLQCPVHTVHLSTCCSGCTPLRIHALWVWRTLPMSKTTVCTKPIIVALAKYYVTVISVGEVIWMLCRL